MICKFLFSCFALFCLVLPVDAVETPVGPVGLGEGPAAGNAVDAFGQLKAPGLIIVDAPDELDFSSDLGESPYKCAIHLKQCAIPAGDLESTVAKLNSLQENVAFTRDRVLLTCVMTAAGIPERAKLFLEILDAPLADLKEVDLNDDTTLTPLSTSIRTLCEKSIPNIETVRVNVWPKERNNFYEAATAPPSFIPLGTGRGRSLRDVMTEQCQAIPGLVWMVRIGTKSVEIMSTTVKADRFKYTHDDLTSDLHVGKADLRNYPDASSRIVDVLREIHKRLIIDPQPMLATLGKSDALIDATQHLKSDSPDYLAHRILNSLLGFRNPDLTALVMKVIESAPKEVSDEFYYSILPGVEGGNPEWMAMFGPMWEKVLHDPNKDIAKRAATLLGHN